MPRKGENIYKRKDGRWEGRYIKERTLSGKAHYGYIYAATYREVKRRLQDIPHESKKGIDVTAATSHTKAFGSIAHEWLRYTQPHIKESTYIKYRNLLNSYIMPFIGEIPLQDITNCLIDSYCTQIIKTGGNAGNGLSPKTASDTLSLIRNILRYASDKGYQISFDAKTVTVKQTPKELRVLTEAEQTKLYNFISRNPDVKSLGVLVCLFTGIRVGEICALKWEDISLTEKTLFIHQTMQRLQADGNGAFKTKVVISGPKSRSSIRLIPIPDELAEAIALMKASNTGYFLTGNDESWIEPRTMQNHFKRILRSCSIADTNYHTLRHTFATRCIELGFDVKSLSEILGHASVNITMNRYVHPSLELKRSNMQRLSTLLTVN